MTLFSYWCFYKILLLKNSCNRICNLFMVILKSYLIIRIIIFLINIYMLFYVPSVRLKKLNIEHNVPSYIKATNCKYICENAPVSVATWLVSYSWWWTKDCVTSLTCGLLTRARCPPWLCVSDQLSGSVVQSNLTLRKIAIWMSKKLPKTWLFFSNKLTKISFFSTK